MITRLVLGCGAVGFDLLQRLPARGTTVVTDDEARAESLREANVDAEAGDLTTPAVHAPAPDVDV
jgi:Trk K+ transport system NAD-binding subunit